MSGPGDRDDYLWDRTGPPDPEVQALERLLARFGHDGRPLAQGRPMPAPGQPMPARRPRLRRWPWIAAAALLVAALGVWFAIGGGQGGELAPGAAARRFAAGKLPEKIQLGDLATITLQPGSELSFVHWTADQALFALHRGGLEARVKPPPAVQARFFQVKTPHGTVIDVGCHYELTLRKDGPDAEVEVRVRDGAVEFAFPQRTVFVPAGAACIVTARGPSTPLFEASTSPELRAAVRDWDALTSKRAPAEMRGEALKKLLGVMQLRPEPRNSLVLWHILFDDDLTFREMAEKELVDLVGMPVPEPTKEMHWDPETWKAWLRRDW